jgi:hypothetical protein
MAFPIRSRSAEAPASAANAAATADAAALTPPHHDGMRRLQIGVAGVCMVLLLVGLAGVATDRARTSAAGNGEVGQEIVSPVINNSAPLEELGIQPVAKDAAASGSGVMVPRDVAVQPRGTVPDLEPDPELARARQANN